MTSHALSQRASRVARSIALAAVAIGGAAGATALQAEDQLPGFQPLSLNLPHHDRPAQGVIWYPTEAAANDPSSSTVQVGENPVFFGTTALEGAEVAEGRYPVVVLSHGLNGHIYTLSWLAAGLVEAGAIVVGVNHPNSTFFDKDLRLGLNHWTRAWDLSATLDVLEDHPEFGDHVDLQQVHAGGFSYGGWTALSMGGLRGNAVGYAEHCDVLGDESSHCADLRRGGVDLRDVDAELWAADYRDDRVVSVAAIDPALHYGIDAEEVAGLLKDVLLIRLGDESNRLLATDFTASGSGFDALVPSANTEIFQPAFHFTALPLCKPSGEAILIEEMDDPVCTDPQGADRAEIHQSIIDAMATHFGLD